MVKTTKKYYFIALIFIIALVTTYSISSTKQIATCWDSESLHEGFKFDTCILMVAGTEGVLKTEEVEEIEAPGGLGDMYRRGWILISVVYRGENKRTQYFFEK